jgi:hypothetical protein
MLNARRMNSTIPLRTCVWGVQNTKDHYLGLHCTGESAQDSHDNATLVKHTHSTPVFHTTSKTHKYAAYNRTHLSKNAPKPPRIMAWLHGAGERAIASEAQVAAHCRNTRTTNERKHSPQHETLACGPPPSRKTCLQYASINPRRAARQPAHPARRIVYLCNRGQNIRSTPP